MQTAPTLKPDDSDPAPAAQDARDEADDTQTYKIKLDNLGRNVSKKEVLKLIATTDIKYKNIKIAPKWTYAVVGFETKDEMEKAIGVLDGFVYKGHSLAAFTLKDRGSRLPYDEQLQKKDKEVHSSLVKLKNELWKYFPKNTFHSELPKWDDSVSPIDRIKEMTSEQRAVVQLAWLREAAKAHNGAPCQTQPIVPSPTKEGYRSKCEFTFGKDLNGEKTCGFLLGLYKEGVHAVLNPKDCLHVTPDGKAIANILEDYIEQSEYDVYDRISKKGVYRSAMVRTMGSGECMVIFQINPTPLSAQQVDDEKSKFTAFFIEHAKQQSVSINSLYFQLSSDVFNGFKDDTPSELVYGTPHITERLLGQR
ncbi:tRNA methyltransferase 2 [Kappamyces sp. JEL0829]|nr:tRNA methyltransferase 2 [Kappamyces sp. JEL0829]